MKDEDRILDLWIRYLASGPLSPEERAELARALEAEEVAGELQEDARLDGLLFAKGWSAASAETFGRGLRERLQAERDATRFVEKVRSGMRAARESSKRPTGRAHGLHRRPPGPAVFLSVVAAAVFLVAVLALFFSPSASLRRTKASSPAPGTIAERPTERERAEEETKGAERDLRAARQREEEAGREREQAKQEELARAAEQAFQKSRLEREAAERRLAEPRERERLAVDPPTPSPEPPKEPAVPKTRVTIARLEKVQGHVSVIAGNERTQAREGLDLLEAQGIVTGAGASATVVYPDKSRVELGPNTTAGELKSQGGKRLWVGAGRLTADVSRQPAGQPLVFVTPHAEAIVLGTTLRLTVDPSSGTRLEVTEGKVRLKSLAGAAVDVLSGYYAVAAAGVDLAAQPILPDTPAVKALTEKGEVTINFGPEGMELPAGVLNDSGEEYDARRGYGWIGPKQGKELPGVTFRNYNTGKIEQVKAGRGAAVRTNALKAVGPLKATAVAAGWLTHSETWVLPFPNGRYRITLCVGDAGAPGVMGYQGPHHVAIEGKVVIDSVSTPKGEFAEVKGLVEIKDGELTMAVGNPRRAPVGADRSSDTSLNYIVIEAVQRGK
jgi:hypothetical protein